MSNIEQGIMNVEGAENTESEKCRMITSIFEIFYSTFCGSKYRLLGFIGGGPGVSNELLMLFIGLLHVSRYVEEGLEEGRGKIPEFQV